MQDLADALVRESVQNSLDARRPRSTVRVRFRFGVGPDALSPEAARHYFQGLREHLEAVSESIHSVIPTDDESVPYLLIEDFGARGLTGDPPPKARSIAAHRILAVADDIRVTESAPAPGERTPLLPVQFTEALDLQAWRVSFEPDTPFLELNNRIAGIEQVANRAAAARFQLRPARHDGG